MDCSKQSQISANSAPIVAAEASSQGELATSAGSTEDLSVEQMAEPRLSALPTDYYHYFKRSSEWQEAPAAEPELHLPQVGRT